jgi:hypothetical protein
MWHGEAFHRLGVQGIKGLILVGAFFPFDGGRRREEKKKEKERKNIAMEKKGFLRAGHTLLAVEQVAAVRCN